MNSLSLNGNWKIRWTDGQRGGAPHYAKEPGQLIDADLLGIEKQISNLFDEVKWIDAIVPGEVHLDLWRAGIIDDPYIRANVLKCRWVEEFMWYYRREFDAPHTKSPLCSVLKFDGLDYGAIVYLNGEEIARHENAFHPLIVNVSGKIKDKSNVLVVRLESGLYTIAEKKVTPLYSATMGVDNLLHKRMWMRKPQFSTAWDWSPRLLNVGIFKDVFLLSSDINIVEQCQVRSNTSKDMKSATLNVRLFLNQSFPLETPVTVKLKINGVSYPAKLNRSDKELSASVTIENPDLWYPLGHGKQTLYTIEMSFYAGDQMFYKETKKTGFRHIEIDQGVHPVAGNYFTLMVNGEKIFAKGANFVPCDMIISAITKERYDKITDLALEANFNLLRVWGGGIYEHDDFYELCDRKGILVWQEFISACATLPYDDKEFAESIHREAIYNIRRLSHYPSLIVWCGNNEVDVHAVKDLKGFDTLPEDTALYFETFPRLVSQEDPEKYYQPSSPYSFDGSPAYNDLVGDQHPWSVGFINKDHRDYRKMECRFANEGGILGPTTLSTIDKCLSPQQRHMHSFEWDIHDNMLENWQVGTSSDENVKFWLSINPRSLSLEEAVFAGGFVQSEGLTSYIDSFRSKKFTCSAAIFWMYNDCWPSTISWTIIDYYLNRTPSFYSVKRAFAPIRVLIVQDNSVFKIIINNDLLSEESLSLRFGLFSCDGAYLLDETKSVSVASNSCDSYATIELKAYSDPDAIPFAVIYNSNGDLLSQNRYLKDKFYEMPLEESAIKVTVNENEVIFQSSVFVVGVGLQISDDENIKDNMFDLFPNIPYSVKKNKDISFGVKYTVNDLIRKQDLDRSNIK